MRNATRDQTCNSAPDKMSRPGPARGLLAPDTSGMNFYRADPALTDLLRIHLPDDDLQPYRAASRPAGRARRRPSRRMRAARRPPYAGPAPARPFRPRRAVDRISPGLSRTGEGRVRRIRHSRDVDPQGHSGLAGQISRGRQARVHVPVQSGRVRPRLPDQCHRWLRQAAGEFRQRGAESKISRRPDPDRHGEADPGRPVHDREGRRLRRRHADDIGRAGGRSLAAHRREMVLLQRRRRRS